MSVNERLSADGIAVVPGVVDGPAARDIGSLLGDALEDRAGARDLLTASWCRALAVRLAEQPDIRAALPRSAAAIQCTLFDKRDDRNWLVALHQDLAVPVLERIDGPALRGWSRKDGRPFVQPPAALLEQLLAVRLHLDDCGSDNGPLRVVPGTHRLGKLSMADAARLRDERGEQVCVVAAGGALLMRPLVLHASSKATRPARRRVLHFVYGPEAPGYGLAWAAPVRVTVGAGGGGSR